MDAMGSKFCDARPPSCQSPVKAFVRGKTVPPDKCNVLLVVTGFMGSAPKVYIHLESFQLMTKSLENSFEDGKCGSKPKSETKVTLAKLQQTWG